VFSKLKIPLTYSQFALKIEIWKLFLFYVYFELPNKFFDLENRKLGEEKKKKKLPNIP